MFGFGGKEKRRSAVVALAAGLPGVLSAMHPVEQATVLVLANGMLRLASADTGARLSEDPAGNAVAAEKAVRDLLAHRDRLAAIVGDEASPNRRHANSHLRSTELALLTVGIGIEPAVREGCIAAWKAARKGVPRLRDAIVWIRRYEGSTGVRAVPSVGSPDDGDLGRLGSQVPACLRNVRSVRTARA
jgi:hypothetical protein